MTVRTRVAPSPTGDPHLGTAYMALFSLCHARQAGGKFLLRIEDTDKARSSQESEAAIIDSLKWLGLDWDEGPDKGGPHAPYRQSERQDIYREHAERLLEGGHAFRCFCTPERLEQMRASQRAAGETMRYDGKCLHLPAEEVAQRLAAGEPSVLRLKVPESGACEVQDALRGAIKIDWAQVDMQVLLKADAMPTYHLAVVVDDHLMGITDIIRGEEWLSSVPKHLLLYQAFGWPVPRFIHLPLLRNPDKSKLSKRRNPTSIAFYRKMGFLPEALVNYLALMGWSLPDGEEKFSLQQMLDKFDIARISLGAPIFDLEKLKWLNGRWIREELSDAALLDRLEAWGLNRDKWLAVMPLVKERTETLADILPMASYLFEGLPALAPEGFAPAKQSQEELTRLLQFAFWRLEEVRDWQRDRLQAALAGLAASMGLKLRDCLAPLFIAITGRAAAPPLFDSMALLGPEVVKARINQALALLGGVSKKRAKSLEKDYRNLNPQGENHVAAG